MVPLRWYCPALRRGLRPFWAFGLFFVAAAVGTLIGTATFYAVGRRRGRYLPQTVAAMVVVGVAPAILGSLVFSLGSFSAVWLIVYVVLATSSAYYRMRY